MLIYTEPTFTSERIVSRVAMVDNPGFLLGTIWGLLVGGIDAYHK